PLLENVNRTLAAALKNEKPAISADTATTSQPAQGGQLAAIAGRNDSLANDTSAAAVAAANNPLFEVMQPSIGQGANGQPMLRPGATIGYVALKDTARVNAYFNHPAVASVIPSNVKLDRKSTRLNSSHVKISYAVFCLKKKTNNNNTS